MTAPLSSFSGLISGFNSRDLVDAIIAQARVPAARMEADMATIRTQVSALGTYRGLLDTLRTAARNLRTGTAFDATTATTTVLSGSRALATVTTGPTATSGQFTLGVTQLARAEKLVGTGVPDATAQLNLAGTFSVNGQDIVVTAADSLSAIRDRINALNTGATPTGVAATILSVSATDHRLILTSTATGAAGITLAESAGTVLQDLGFLDGGGQKVPAAVLTSGADAQFTIDGMSMTRTSNVIADAIEGVTLTLVSEELGASTAITVGRFGEAAENAMRQFVEAHNAVVNFLKTQGTVGDSRPPLYGEALLRTARSALPTLLLGDVNGAAADLATVARAGLSLTRDGLLTFDAAVFGSAFSTRYADLRTLFTEQLHSAAAGLSLVSTGANPNGGTWDVEVTTVAARPTLVSAGFNGTYDDGGTPDTLTVTDTQTGRFVDVVLSTGMSTTDIQSAIQAALDAEGIGITATVEGQDLRLTGGSYGSHAGIQVSVAGTGDGASELFGAPVTAFGIDVAGTIGGLAATGSGQMLVGNAGTSVAGISVLHTGGVAGPAGSVTATIGAGARVERLLDTFLSAGDGMLATKEAQLNARTGRLQDRVLALDARLARRREALLRSFLMMENAVARLQQQSNSLLGLSTGNQDR